MHHQCLLTFINILCCAVFTRNGVLVLKKLVFVAVKAFINRWFQGIFETRGSL